MDQSLRYPKISHLIRFLRLISTWTLVDQSSLWYCRRFMKSGKLTRVEVGSLSHYLQGWWYISVVLAGFQPSTVPSNLSTMYIGRLRSWRNSTETIYTHGDMNHEILLGQGSLWWLLRILTYLDTSCKTKMGFDDWLFLLQAKHWIPTTSAPQRKKSIMSLLLEVNLWLKKTGSTDSPRNSFHWALSLQLGEISSASQKKQKPNFLKGCLSEPRGHTSAG